MQKKILFFLLALCTGMTSLAQSVTVESSLDSTVILIGEQLHLRTKVCCPKDARVKFPDFRGGSITDGVEVLEAGKIDTSEVGEGRRWELSREYTLTAFDSAVYTIPRVEVDVNGAKYQSPNEIGLKVNSVDVDLQHPDDIRPPKAPVDGVFSWGSGLLKASVSIWLFLAIFIICAVRLATAKPVTRKVKIIPPTPPHKTAIAAIEELKNGEREGEHLKEYYMALTDVLRQYINDRFGFNAREMTTFEIVDKLRTTGDASALDELHEILSTADLVKFAKYEASLAESDRTLLQAVDYVRTTQINDPAAEQAVEREVVVSDAGQRRYKLALKSGMALSFLAALGIFSYVSYQLWLNFF